jgi:hypothetical protein
VDELPRYHHFLPEQSALLILHTMPASSAPAPSEQFVHPSASHAKKK